MQRIKQHYNLVEILTDVLYIEEPTLASACRSQFCMAQAQRVGDYRN
jgi:hypothetical protein